jgi:predicted NUDIX family NTP pyrophosphohydrolase
MPRLSAGLLMYRVQHGQLQVFLAHLGGPFYVRKDDGSWTIPKGEPEPNEDLLDAAKREFEEETGIVPTGPFIPLTPVNQNLLPWHQPPVRWSWKGQSGRRTGSRVWQAKRVPPR